MSKPIEWIQRLQSLAQSGLAYTKDPYDQERFEAIQKITLEMLSYLTELSPGHAKQVFFEERGYRTPKLDVRAGIFEGDRVLLVCERSDGLWTLPGGWVDINESPSQ